MLLDLLDLLRCPAGHEDTPLVSAVTRVDEREVVEGLIGCPVCHARYHVEGGVLVMGTDGGAGTDPAVLMADDPEETIRLAALLGLTEPGGLVLLAGGWSALAPSLARTFQVQVLVADPPLPILGGGVSTMRGAARVPLAPRALRAAALDEPALAEPFAGSLLHALRPRGRSAGPVSAPVPAFLTELARDERHWVAELPPVASPPVRIVTRR